MKLTAAAAAAARDLTFWPKVTFQGLRLPEPLFTDTVPSVPLQSRKTQGVQSGTWGCQGSQLRREPRKDQRLLPLPPPCLCHSLGPSPLRVPEQHGSFVKLTAEAQVGVRQAAVLAQRHAALPFQRLPKSFRETLRGHCAPTQPEATARQGALCGGTGAPLPFLTSQLYRLLQLCFVPEPTSLSHRRKLSLSLSGDV